MRGNVWRAVAILAAVAATALIYVLVIRDEGGGDGPERKGGGEEVPEAVRGLVESLSPEQKVDGILLVGFEGVDSSAPFLAQLRERQLGGVLVRSENWLDAFSGTQLIAELKAAGREGGLGSAADRRPPGRRRVPLACRPAPWGPRAQYRGPGLTRAGPELGPRDR